MLHYCKLRSEQDSLMLPVTIYDLATVLMATVSVMNNSVSVAGGPWLATLECAGRGLFVQGGNKVPGGREVNSFFRFA